jgi:hypothetical protein
MCKLRTPREVFTPEEATIALAMSAIPETVEKSSTSSGMPRAARFSS